MNLAPFLKNLSLTVAAILITLIALVVSAVMWMSAMPGNPTPAQNTLSDKALAERLEAHVKALAFERNVRHAAALDRAAAYIEHEIKSYGYEVTSQWFDTEGVRVRNLVATVPAGSAHTPPLYAKIENMIGVWREVKPFYCVRHAKNWRKKCQQYRCSMGLLFTCIP